MKVLKLIMRKEWNVYSVLLWASLLVSLLFVYPAGCGFFFSFHSFLCWLLMYFCWFLLLFWHYHVAIYYSYLFFCDCFIYVFHSKFYVFNQFQLNLNHVFVISVCVCEMLVLALVFVYKAETPSLLTWFFFVVTPIFQNNCVCLQNSEKWIKSTKIHTR